MKRIWRNSFKENKNSMNNRHLDELKRVNGVSADKQGLRSWLLTVVNSQWKRSPDPGIGALLLPSNPAIHHSLLGLCLQCQGFWTKAIRYPLYTQRKPTFPLENFSGEPAELTWHDSWSFFHLSKNFKIFKTHQKFSSKLPFPSRSACIKTKNKLWNLVLLYMFWYPLLILFMHF